ncbi:hypothetical protein ALQ08_200073 [Pseudomonas syringae pv. delphinii]|uniref:Uncharacterized protein n=1 Tax=Pseudomonas syringae pv. delphinii TaxID=192088 RepID=A0A3M4K483_9PSED|nr:hypothetical protein ALQ08_200073 [Pseudomonas syringae pv. delphinii]
MILRARPGLVADRRLDGLAAYHALQAQLSHQTLHRTAGDLQSFTQQLSPDLAHAIYLEVLIPDSLDVLTQFLVTLRTR